MMKILSTAAVALAVAAPGWAVAQPAQNQAQGGQTGQQGMQQQRMQQQDQQGMRAQQGRQQQGQQRATVQGLGVPVVALTEWRYDELYQQGWRGEQLLDAEVYGPTGEEIGDVENVILDGEGRIVSIIAEIGGFWDIGDTHINVPWNQVEVAPNFERVTIPVTEENVEEFGLFGENNLLTRRQAGQLAEVDDDLATAGRTWKLSELVDDYVTLRGGIGYGYVEDAIFGQDGRLQAVLVNRDVAYGVGGPYAYPFYGYGRGFDPGLDYYEMPYGEGEVADMEPFEYERMD